MSAKVKAITPAIQRFIELERKKEEVKKYFEELNNSIKEVVDEIGIGTFFQDPTDRTVYQIVEPEGRFVNYERYSYIRTKREGEVRGSLSVKKAEEAGFELK
jgi:hypothetical protein